MKVRAIISDSAPSPKGHYSHAVEAGGLLFCSAQIGVDPETGTLAPDVATQSTQALENLEAICRDAGTTLMKATRLTLYLTDLADLPTANRAFVSFFGDTRPARSTLVASSLVGGAQIGIDAIAALD